MRTVRTEPTPQTIGQHLRAVRQKRGLLQRELARELGVTDSTVVHWERGTTAPLPKDGPGIVAFLGYLPLPMATLGEKLYAVRFANGWTQAEAGAACGVSEDGWRAWEGGATPMPAKLSLLSDLIVRSKLFSLRSYDQS